MTHATAYPPAETSHGHAHHETHEHPEHLAHHWDSLEQQFEAGTLGMWLFLATEILLFGDFSVATRFGAAIIRNCSDTAARSSIRRLARPTPQF